MKHIKLLILSIVAIAMAACSSSREITQADIIKHNAAVEHLTNKKFMIKGNRLILEKRTYPGVSSSTNFVMVNGDEATVQVSPGVSGGPNGVGGFTVKGSISGYEVKTKSNGAVNVKYNVQSISGSCSVFINLPKNGVNATVTINSTFRGTNATLYGDVSAIDNSIFVGKTKF